jgi:exopolysaccharide biosynthesis protein
VDYFQGKTVTPQLECWALRIDLSAPNTRIVVRGGAYASGADENGTLSVKVSSFVRDNNLLAGINAVPFDVVSARENQPIKNMGLVISDGKLTSSVNPNYDALVFYKNGGAAIVNQTAIRSSIENIENAVGGFHQILTGAQAAQRTQDSDNRHPRSAAGVSANGKILYLLVIDGRRAGSEGKKEKETAFLLRALGCHDGINLDGGGSTALALRYPDGNIRTVNTPVHGGIPGRERAVAGCIGIALNPSTGK